MRTPSDSRAVFPIALAEAHRSDVGQQYKPSNGTEGECFIGAWCANCARDKVMNGEADEADAFEDETLHCEILGASFRGEAQEWQYGADGQPVCTAFVQLGQALPVPRCPHTRELPLWEAA